MADENSTKPRRGRPRLAEGEGYTSIHLSLAAPLTRAVDAAAAGEEDLPSRPEMIRRLVVAGLASQGRKIE
ncbi:hypothetical protein SQ03_27030 [Methylobacterium platani JCM 14648]|uniref:Ribbon-helix-helix protein CopG domain-containing protein n=2 Tax=Methylobacterium platani TaxID=427683 RepID=A0A179SIB2_9HYPH|nr:hypothetical protein SQ03_27030 [Methylobacterium platani JCM 14648]OAS26303.1 hypothetical protein A5481_06200 [Methylobacterium platani]